MSFASEPGRDDGNLPPANIVVPDDARELDRDVLAYHRELRARRRRQRIARLLGTSSRREYGRHVAILPLIATIVALSMLAGAMLSVITISPASAPTVPPSPGISAAPAGQSAAPALLPLGTVRLNGKTVPVRHLTDSALALVPAGCQCGPALRRLAGQAVAAHAGVYFVASDLSEMPQLAGLTQRYGDGVAQAVYDTGDVLGATYHPVGLTVLLVYSDSTAEVRRHLQPAFELAPDLQALALPGY